MNAFALITLNLKIRLFIKPFKIVKTISIQNIFLQPMV